MAWSPSEPPTSSDAARCALPAGEARPPMMEDAPTTVRPGEELDPAALAAYLARAVPGFEGVRADELRVEQFGQGFSNLTYLVRAGDAEVVLRRPPLGVGRGVAHDVGREYRILAALATS